MYNKFKLDNGIRVVAEKIPYVNSISLGIWVKSGSRYETVNNNGVAHFIEHMLFKGTSNRSPKKIAEEIEELGGQINAFTGKEATCFYIKMLDAHLDVGIDVLSDMIINSKFDEEEIEKEKGVIIEEIRMYDDSPEDLVIDLLSYATWGNDALSLPILGTEKTVNALNRDSILEYFNKYYVAENIVISITGNFDEDVLIKLLNEKIGYWKTKFHSEAVLSTPTVHNGVSVKNKDIEQIHFALTFDGIELGNNKLYSLLALNNYFGGGTSSRLFQSLREEMGYVYTIYSFPSPYKNKGIFNVYFALNRQYMNNAMDLIYNEIQHLLKNKMNSNQISKAKEQLKGNYILGLESVSSRMFGMGKSELLLNAVYEPKDILDIIDSIKDDEVHNLIEDVFNKGVLSAAVVGKDLCEDDIKSLIWR